MDVFQHDYFFSPLAAGKIMILLWSSVWWSGRILCRKTCRFVEASLRLGPPGVFILRLVPTEPPVFCQLLFRLLYPGNGSCGYFCFWASALVSCDSLNLPASLANLGSSVLLSDLNSLDGSKKSYSVFFWYLFLLWGSVWHPPNSLHVRSATGSPDTNCFCTLYFTFLINEYNISPGGKAFFYFLQSCIICQSMDIPDLFSHFCLDRLLIFSSFFPYTQYC